LVMTFACNSEPETTETKVEDTTKAAVDTQPAIVDHKTTDMLEDISKIRDQFVGKFEVYNSEEKKLKNIEIAEDGEISHSNIYKLFRIAHINGENYILLYKGTDETTAACDTFTFQSKEKAVKLYLAAMDKKGKMVRGDYQYKFKRID